MSADDLRPKPEKFLSLIREQRAGRLKIYLGFAPGVGKTYEMLQEAQRLKRQGVDVVIGVVETHGRAETLAQVGDVEQVPRRRLEYHGVTLEEMDLDAVLRRKPTVVIVDELPHTNAPGGLFAKRFQDVEELLKHGINVVSAMNVQHLESLCDVVEQFTGVKVKERVPDYILAKAHQLVNVDLPAEDLQDRLAAGKIYPPDRSERALANFFTSPNLTRLRELALEEIAHLLDKRRDRQGDTTTTGSDRVMVSVSSRSPAAMQLLRKAARHADRLRAPWFAVYIQTPADRTEKVDAATQRRVTESLTLARQLGGIPMQLQAAAFAAAVADFVKEYAVTQILVGRTSRPWYRRWFGQSPLEQLLRAVPAADVVVCAGEAA